MKVRSRLFQGEDRGLGDQGLAADEWHDVGEPESISVDVSVFRNGVAIIEVRPADVNGVSLVPAVQSIQERASVKSMFDKGRTKQ